MSTKERHERNLPCNSWRGSYNMIILQNSLYKCSEDDKTILLYLESGARSFMKLRVSCYFCFLLVFLFLFLTFSPFPIKLKTTLWTVNFLIYSLIYFCYRNINPLNTCIIEWSCWDQWCSSFMIQTRRHQSS